MMGFLTDLYDDNVSVSAAFRNKTYSQGADGSMTLGYSATDDLVAQGFYWVGSKAEGLIKEALKPVVQGVFVCNYEDYTATVSDDAKCTIGSKVYSVVYVENIAEQNEVILIPLKEFQET